VLFRSDWCFEWCLPLWLPFLLLTFLTAAPYAWWRVRRAERKETAKGGPPWERRRRWRSGLALYGIFSLLLGLLLLPIPLVLYCGLTCRYEDMSDHRRTLARLMPVLAQREALPVSVFLQDHVRERVTWHLLDCGMLQPELLAELIRGRGEIGQYSGGSTVGLWKSDPEYAQTLTDDLLAGRDGALGGPLSGAGRWIGQNAPTATIRRYLGLLPGSAWSPFHDSLLGTLVSMNRSDLLPDLEECAMVAGANRARFVPFLAQMAPAQDAERIWRGFAVDPELSLREAAAKCLGILERYYPDVTAAVIVDFLADREASIRRAALSALLPEYAPPAQVPMQGVLAQRQKEIKPAHRAALLRRLVELLDDPSVSYQATLFLSGFVVLSSPGNTTNWEKLREELRGKVAAELKALPDAPDR
jgi:hypothetical protein